jgi:hypothetical protein
MQTTPLIAGKRALPVYPSDNTDIPFPQLVTSGITDGNVSPTFLEDSTNPMLNSSNIKAGYIVYNNALKKSATVLDVLGPGTVVLNDGIFASAGESYSVYASAEETANEGCVVYVGGQGGNEDVQVTTSGGDVVVFHKVPLGTYLPIVVKKVWVTNTTAINLVAIW